MTSQQIHRTTKSLGRRPKDMPGGRQALVAAGIKSFAAYGFDGADVRSIAALAGVTANLVRVHFGGKAELWNVCAESIVSDAAPIIDRVAHLSRQTDLSIFHRLSDIILTTAAFYRIHRDVRDFVFRALAEGSERTTFIAEKLLVPAYEAARAALDEGMSAGIVRCSHPAFFFVAMTNALSQSAFFPDLFSKIAPEVPPDDVHWIMTQSLISMLLHAPKNVPC